jgi:hypothetical protein
VGYVLLVSIPIGSCEQDLRSVATSVGIDMLDSPAQVETNIRSILRKAARRRRSDDRSERIWTISTSLYLV